MGDGNVDAVNVVSLFFCLEWLLFGCVLELIVVCVWGVFLICGVVRKTKEQMRHHSPHPRFHHPIIATTQAANKNSRRMSLKIHKQPQSPPNQSFVTP